MPPKKPRCAFRGCSDRPQLISGTCDLCEKDFCGKHRLYEDHNCPQLEEVGLQCPRAPTPHPRTVAETITIVSQCKKELHERNAAKLERQKTEVVKG